MRIVFESLVTTPDGLDLQPAKHAAILNLITQALNARDPSPATVIYEVAGRLKLMGSYRAAESLLQMMMNTVATVQNERGAFAGARL